jgi:hypothetical protein
MRSPPVFVSRPHAPTTTARAGPPSLGEPRLRATAGSALRFATEAACREGLPETGLELRSPLLTGYFGIGNFLQEAKRRLAAIFALAVAYLKSRETRPPDVDGRLLPAAGKVRPNTPPPRESA